MARKKITADTWDRTKTGDESSRADEAARQAGDETEVTAGMPSPETAPGAPEQADNPEPAVLHEPEEDITDPEAPEDVPDPEIAEDAAEPEPEDTPDSEDREEAAPGEGALPADVLREDLSGSDEDNDTDFLDEEALAQLSAEEKYKHALSVARMAARMQRYDYQDTYYRKALRELKPLFDDVEEAKPRFKKIRRKMHNARANHRITAYEKACEYRDTAKTADDYAFAADKFAEIAEYDIKHKLKEKFTKAELYAEADRCTDCAEQEAYCRKKQTELLNRKRNRGIALLVLAAVLLVGGGLFTRTASWFAIKGALHSAMGHPGKSWQAYYESWQRKEDPGVYEKYLENRYEAAVAAAASEQPSDAREDLFVLAGENYRDSGELYVALERQMLDSLKPGKKVTFANVKWVLLDRQGSKLLLLKDSFVRKTPFHEEGGAVTWENSSVRDFLNHEYYEERFLEPERAMVMETVLRTGNNRIAGTDGGGETTDTLFLLSTEEAEQYMDLLKDTEETWWLRTPGASQEAMSFVDTDRSINDIGYDVSSDQIRVRPAVWIDIAE